MASGSQERMGLDALCFPNGNLEAQTRGSRSRAFGQGELRKGNPQLEGGAALAAWHELSVWSLNCSRQRYAHRLRGRLILQLQLLSLLLLSPAQNTLSGRATSAVSAGAEQCIFSPTISFMYAEHEQIQRSIMEETKLQRFCSGWHINGLLFLKQE